MTPEQWLSKEIKDRGTKQRYIAEKTGIPERKLSAILTGRRRVQAGELISICNVVGINPLDYPVPPVVGGKASA